ncbi:MAG: hypothetical protein KDA24_22350 [Deltaproteobacteria bacterium]|nr:hypothetical protein [Deltaproteobacteria bacterium]
MDEYDALRGELEIVVMDVVAGGPNTSKLHHSIRRVIEARLRRRIGTWLKDFDVTVGPDSTGVGIEVAVRLQTRQEARMIRLRTGAPIR